MRPRNTHVLLIGIILVLPRKRRSNFSKTYHKFRIRENVFSVSDSTLIFHAENDDAFYFCLKLAACLSLSAIKITKNSKWIFYTWIIVSELFSDAWNNDVPHLCLQSMVCTLWQYLVFYLNWTVFLLYFFFLSRNTCSTHFKSGTNCQKTKIIAN